MLAKAGIQNSLNTAIGCLEVVKLSFQRKLESRGGVVVLIPGSRSRMTLLNTLYGNYREK
jgi:hypothetical protein